MVGGNTKNFMGFVDNRKYYRVFTVFMPHWYYRPIDSLTGILRADNLQNTDVKLTTDSCKISKIFAWKKHGQFTDKYF